MLRHRNSERFGPRMIQNIVHYFAKREINSETRLALIYGLFNDPSRSERHFIGRMVIIFNDLSYFQKSLPDGLR